MEFKFENISCPLCGSTDALPYRKAKDRFHVVDQEFVLERCEGCGFVYQNPRVTIDTIFCFYPDNYYSSRPGRNTRQHRQSKKIVRRKCKFIDKYFDRPGNLLEIGSANGEFLVGMRDNKWEVQGVEPSQDGAEYSNGKLNLKVFNGDLVARPDDGERFDAIVLWAVLPHIHDPVKVLSHAVKLLALDGKLIICCANIDSLASNYMKDNWGHLDLPRHYGMWSPSTIKKIFELLDLSCSEIVHSDDIFKSRLTFRWIYSIIKKLEDPRKGITLKKLVRLAFIKLNDLITYPVLTYARKRKVGGIITAIGAKRN